MLATGFKADSFMRPMEVVGRNGLTLDRAWTPRPEAYLSISIPGFPNFFMLNGPNGPIGNFSLIEVAELQFGYIMQLIDRLRSGDCREICATPQALAEFEQARDEAAHTDGVGHRLSELVPRRPGPADGLAVVVRPVPPGDEGPGPGGLRVLLTHRELKPVTKWTVSGGYWCPCVPTAW